MTTRRTFLGAATALATLSDPTRAASPADHELVTRSDVPGEDYELPASAGSIYVERFGDDADVHLSTYTKDPHVCATVNIAGEWGEAGLSLTPEQAEALGSALLAAVGEWERGQ